MLLPVSWSSCGFASVALAPSCALVVHQWGSCWGGQTHSLGGVELVSLLVPHTHTLMASCLASSPKAPAGEEQSQVSRSYTLGLAHLPVPTPTRPALLCYPGEVQATFLSAAVRRGRAVSVHSLDINMGPGNSPNHGLSHGLWW